MSEYHKIQSLFKRKTTGSDKGKFISEFTTPEFEYLYGNEWIGTEKIDGVNIRISKSYGIKGRTDNALIPYNLVPKLVELHKKINWDIFDTDNVVFYGEGYGCKIQKGEKYIPDDVDFILFDISIDGIYVRREIMIDIVSSLDIDLKIVPVVFEGPMYKALTQVHNGFKSTIADCTAEGMVLVPKINMLNHRGERIITKIKYKDYNKE